MIKGTLCFSPSEMQYRFKIFMQNLESSRELQALELGTARYGVTQFSDLTGKKRARALLHREGGHLGRRD